LTAEPTVAVVAEPVAEPAELNATTSGVVVTVVVVMILVIGSVTGADVEVEPATSLPVVSVYEVVLAGTAANTVVTGG
jgi:hypothetical protein